MRARLTRLGAALAALAALAVGGAALASAAHKGTPPAPPATTQSQQEGSTAADGDNVQQGDQSAPDTTGEQADPASEQVSESGPSDGPGGYADTSANADTQQEGEH